MIDTWQCEEFSAEHRNTTI